MKPKNGGLKPSSQDYMNLLYSESDSDPPDLKLPPLKGKKPRKKKSSYKSAVSGDTSVCSIWVMLKIIVVIVMLATLSVLGVVSYWLMGQVNDLKVQLQQVENGNQGAPEEFQKYHSQIQDLNRTVNKLRTGENGIDKIAKNITQLATQLISLNKVTKELKDGLDTAPELKNLPKELKTLTSSVVDMGSDIQIAQGKLDSLEEFKKSASEDLDVLKKKVADMENKTQLASIPSGGREHEHASNSDNRVLHLNEKLQMLSLDIDTLNKSLTSKLGTLNSSLLLHEQRLSLLENFTSQQTSTAGSSTGEDKNSNTLKKLLEGGTSSGSPSEGDLLALSSLLDKVDNITGMVGALGHLYEKLQSDIVSVNHSISSTGMMQPLQGMEEFALFQTDTLSNLEYLNSTVLKLNDSVVHLFRLFVNNKNELTNVSAYVSGILNHLAIISGNPRTTPLPVGVTSPQSTKTEPTAIPTETTPAPIIKIASIKNIGDLTLSFNRWDRQGSGQVDPEDLQDFMPDPPTSEQLKPFDVDNNGKYSLEELAAALGFTSDTSTGKTDDIPN